MDKLTLGLLAHVDAGKTTLTEALLYRGGVLRRLGRVDHADAFLDTDVQERERGITIFSKQAVLPLDDLELTLLDTPGHVDFSAEAEAVLGALDCAVLVVSAPDGIQGHTLTLWKLLERHRIPVFLFLNKMDQPGVDRESLLQGLRAGLSDAVVDFSAHGQTSFWEECALGDESALEEYMDSGGLSDGTLRGLIGERKLYPCFFGSALKLEGVDELLSGLERFAPRPSRGEEFSARVFKISRDNQGTRLTHIKLTGGALKVKAFLGEEKAEQIRIYSGAKYTAADMVLAGTLCAVVGPEKTFAGQALGAERPWTTPALEPALAYQVILPAGCDPHAVLPKLRTLDQEFPKLGLEWNEALREIHVRLMGEVQAEVLKRVIRDRFGLEVEFGAGSIVYRETLSAPVEGIGHFEPLRHYAEVHILLEPLPAGSGIQVASAVPTDVLALNWQRLALTHLAEKSHRGTLTGSALTDVRMTLVAGRAHEKHTEGGDFRQATYRAVRQGLMKAKRDGHCVLLEPWYDFRLELPAGQLGRAINDIQRMGGESAPPKNVGEEGVLTGSAPVAGLRDYAGQVVAYTRGRGRLTCSPGGYRPCAHPETVTEAMAYDPERDAADPTGSVFCSHGAGHEIPWNEVDRYAHLPLLNLSLGGEEPAGEASSGLSGRLSPPPAAPPSDKELRAIFEKTYGTIKPRDFRPAGGNFKPRPTLDRYTPETVELNAPTGPEYLLVDGYNIVFAWEELRALARENLELARKTLADLLCDYQSYRQNRVILVFDAYKVPQGVGSAVRYQTIRVIYTREAETADSYIEKASYRLAREGNRIRVATSDGPEQFIILGHGALRVSAQELRSEMEQTRGEIASILRRNNVALPRGELRAAFERAERKRSGESNPGKQ